MPARERYVVAFLGVLSIASLNLTLSLNTVGFYQMTKLSLIPLIVLLEMLKGVRFSILIVVALGFLICGVGMATLNDVGMTAGGS